MKLLEPYVLNSLITLKNRIVMAPMTRAMANDDNTPTLDTANYYSRRADAGLIVTEGTVISPDGFGHKNVPGIFNKAQVKAWQSVTGQVHKAGGLIFSQIWHVGRVSHPSFLNGQLPVSASETLMTERIPRNQGLFFGKSRAATINEIQNLIEQFADAAKNAMLAGFDGVEIHGANGYLIDQFLHYDTNKRDDEFGGTAANMARFPLDVVRACGDSIGFEKLGLRISPGGYLHEIKGDARDESVFKYFLGELDKLGLAYVHSGNFDDGRVFSELSERRMSRFIRENYTGTVIGCGGYTVERGEEAIVSGEFDLLALGRPFIANPDLVERVRNKETLKGYDVGMLGKLL